MINIKSGKEMDDINYLLNKIQNQKTEITELKKTISKQNELIDSIPQMSRGSIGYSTSDKKITYRNWWTVKGEKELTGYFDGMWFTRYIQSRFPDEDYKLNIFSVFGRHYNLTEKMPGKKIFYSGEDMNYRFRNIKNEFGPYALSYVDLAMGYDLIDNDKYLRFPGYLRYIFKPNVNEKKIEDTFNDFNSLNYEKTKDVALIASHDRWKTRTAIANDIQDYVNIEYAGRWRNNTRELWDKFNDKKNEYLKQFKFNVCPENLVDDAYVTEKIFQSIQTNCIPLYMGGGNYLEPKILNKDAILIWKPDEDNTDVIELFKNLMTDEKSYSEFKDQNVILDTAAKHVIKKFKTFDKHLERLICS